MTRFSRRLLLSLGRLGGVLFLFILFNSCHYKDLCYDHNHGDGYNVILKLILKLDLGLDLEINPQSNSQIEMPDYMKVCFYGPEDGRLKNTEFVTGEGGPLYTAPGIYNMVVYSFGTEYVQIRGEGDINTLEAFTSDITATKGRLLAGFTRSGEYEAPGPIIYTPDHLLVARKEIEIPTHAIGETVITVTATASTIVETYGFEVRNIQGLEYISSVEAFVTNQARSSFFGRGEVNNSPATLYFPVDVDLKKGVLYTTFNTFGKLPGESHSYLHILLVDTEGQEYRISTDITDQFEKEDHEIIIEDEIDIPQPTGGGGGIAPTVDPWDETIHDVPIG